MGLKTTERPPTPRDSSTVHPRLSLRYLNHLPARQDRSVPHYSMLQGSGAGGVTGAWSVSPAVPDTRSRETDNAGNTCGGRSPWDGLARGTTGASRTSPRLASPTAERHLASLLQQLRRER
ncbi:hypothetical protein MRX96_009133 [Rhipicephalus microplus]